MSWWPTIQPGGLEPGSEQKARSPRKALRLAQGSQLIAGPPQQNDYTKGLLLKLPYGSFQWWVSFSPSPFSPRKFNQNAGVHTWKYLKEEKEKHRPKPTNFWVGFKCLSVRFRWCFSHSLLSKHPRAADLDSTNPPQDFPGWWFEIFFYCHPYWGQWWNLTNIFPTN